MDEIERRLAWPAPVDLLCGGGVLGWLIDLCKLVPLVCARLAFAFPAVETRFQKYAPFPARAFLIKASSDCFCTRFQNFLLLFCFFHPTTLVPLTSASEFGALYSCFRVLRNRTKRPPISFRAQGVSTAARSHGNKA